MGSVTRTELNQQTARILARVATGERIVITDRGRPVAEIAPYSGSKWDELVATGRITPARATGALSSLPALREESTADTLGHVRGDRA